MAGLNTLFDDPDGTVAEQAAVGVTVSPLDSFRFGATAFDRGLHRSYSAAQGDSKQDDWDDAGAVTFVYWTPSDWVAVSLEPRYEKFSRNLRDVVDGVIRLDTISVPLVTTYFDPSGWFVSGEATFYRQNVEEVGDASHDVVKSEDSGLIVNLGAGYRLPRWRGIVGVQVLNATDRRLHFQDDAFRTQSDDVNPQFLPSRTFLATLTLNF